MANRFLLQGRKLIRIYAEQDGSGTRRRLNGEDAGPRYQSSEKLAKLKSRQRPSPALR
ncbi:MAG: hypothetical protein WA624_22240 [Methylocella sp.]